MLTRNDALTANEFHYGQCVRSVGPRGGVTIRQEVWRRNGATKTWKTRPTEFTVPVKHGMYTYGHITTRHTDSFHTSDNCPLNEVGDGR